MTSSVGGSEGIRSYFRAHASSAQFPELNGLRGLAVLLVVARHSIRLSHDPARPLWNLGGFDVATVLLNGWMGVDLFFVLSGFLIAHHLLRAIARDGRFRPQPYFLKRGLRILPTYFAVLALLAVGAFPFYSVVRGTPEVYLYHLLFLQDYLPASLVVAFWSLGVEEKLYLLLPLLLLYLQRLPSPRQAVVTLLALASLGPLLRAATYFLNRDLAHSYDQWFPLVRSPFHLNWDPLLLGVLCAWVLRAGRTNSAEGFDRRKLFLPSMGLGLLLLAGRPWLDRFDFAAAVWVPLLLAVACAGMVAALTCGRGPVVGTALLRSRFLDFFSTISFPLYLVHMLFLERSRSFLEALPLGALREPALLAAAHLGLVLVLSTGLAVLLHFLVEKPFLLMKERVGQREMIPQRATR